MDEQVSGSFTNFYLLYKTIGEKSVSFYRCINWFSQPKLLSVILTTDGNRGLKNQAPRAKHLDTQHLIERENPRYWKEQ